MMKRGLCMVLILLLLLPCGLRASAEEPEGGEEIVIVTEPPVPEETPLPVETPEPTETEIPEETPEPTQTGETPAPTETPTPTEAPAPTDTPEPTVTEPVLPTSIEIDTENCYFGMDCAYRDGYQPTIENEIVTIVLPLQSTDRLLDDKITVTPDLSATGTTFVIANYQKTVSLSPQRINGTEETREIFYVDFSIPLSSARANGSYPVRLQVKAYDLNYTPIETVFTVYVNITDVPPTPTNTGGPETPTAEPVVLIARSEIMPEIAMAGEAFTIKLTIRNSLDTKLVRNMLLRVDTGNLQLNLNEDSHVIPLEGLDRGGEREIELHFSSDPSIPAGKYIINFTFSYDSNKTLNLSSSGSVIVEIKQPASIELVMPRMPDQVNAGDSLPLSFQVINVGRDTLYNVRCELFGFGLFPENTGYIGTLAVASSSTTKINLYIGSLTMSDSYTGEEKYGETTGTVTLVYEDSSGEEFREDYCFSLTIGRPIITISRQDSEKEHEEKAETAANQWWISVAALFAAIIALSYILFYRRRHKKL